MIAYELKVPLYVIQEMPYDEFVKWQKFFGMYPPGFREDIRASHIMSSLSGKSSLNAFPSLANLGKLPGAKKTGMSTFHGSSMHHFILNSVGGDKLNL